MDSVMMTIVENLMSVLKEIRVHAMSCQDCDCIEFRKESDLAAFDEHYVLVFHGCKKDPIIITSGGLQQFNAYNRYFRDLHYPVATAIDRFPSFEDEIKKINEWVAKQRESAKPKPEFHDPIPSLEV